MPRDFKFVHLRMHSDCSMVNGLNDIRKIMKRAGGKGLGFPAIAITDTMNFCTLVKLTEDPKGDGAGLKPICSVELNIHDAGENRVFRQCAYAMNDTGRRCLFDLVSRAYLRGYLPGHDFAAVEFDWLKDYSDGVIMLSGGREGDVGCFLLQGDREKAAERIAFYKKYFPDRYYLELIRTGRPDEDRCNDLELDTALREDLPVVATNDCMFLEKKDFQTHEIRVALHDGYVMADPRRPKRFSPEQYLKTEEEMCALFSDVPEALENSVEIARRCSVAIRTGHYFLPQYKTKHSQKSALIRKTVKGFFWRMKFLYPDPEERKKQMPRYKERLRKELKIIIEMGFPGYFLIVMEFIQWSKDNGIPIGPGRGSGAGSLVAYCIQITDLDPLRFDLLFERFLNPERVSMPDFDVDMCQARRGDIIRHVKEYYTPVDIDEIEANQAKTFNPEIYFDYYHNSNKKLDKPFGGEHSHSCSKLGYTPPYIAVSQIITFGTMAAKAAIKDAGRALGYSYTAADNIAKLIPSKPVDITIRQALEAEPKLKHIYDTDEKNRYLIDVALSLEGVTKSYGKHAGGIVISPTLITDFAPLICEKDGSQPVTQFDKHDVEEVGLVKFDFLGLKTLTIIKWALDMINLRLKREGKPLFSLDSISLDDHDSFQNLLACQTVAVFQLESPGMRNLIAKLKPDCFDDIIALVALFRPGPLDSGMVDNFINRKHGLEKIAYPQPDYQHSCLEEALKPTYGVVVYQEQVMQIAQQLAGYTLGGADLLRRAMGKKIKEEMVKHRAIFVDGAVKKWGESTEGKNTRDLAGHIFDIVEKFAGYGFNKSHSAAYALVAYQTLWLKTHFPAEFIAANMTSDNENIEKMMMFLKECGRLSIKVLPPYVNQCQAQFSVDENGAIVYGLMGIKGVGQGPVEAIISERDKNGPYKDLFDFCNRIDLSKVSRNVLELLVKSGALDGLWGEGGRGGIVEQEGKRAVLLATLPVALDYAARQRDNRSTGQGDLFSDSFSVDPTRPDFLKVPEWPQQTILDGEKKAVGLYLTGHPLTQYLDELSHYHTTQISQVPPNDKFNRNRTWMIGGYVQEARVMKSKSGRPMAFATIDDSTGTMEISMFDHVDEFEEFFQVGRIIIATGTTKLSTYQNTNGQTVMQAMKIIDIEEARKEYSKGLRIDIEESLLTKSRAKELRDLILKFRDGPFPLELCYHSANARIIMEPDPCCIDPSDEFLNGVRLLFGKDSVSLKF